MIDDAPVDDTGGVAAQAGARVLSLPKNGGKSAAVAAGLRVARGELVMFLDADLIGLTADQVTALVSPALTGQSDGTIRRAPVSRPLTGAPSAAPRCRSDRMTNFSGFILPTPVPPDAGPRGSPLPCRATR